MTAVFVSAAVTAFSCTEPVQLEFAFVEIADDYVPGVAVRSAAA